MPAARPNWTVLLIGGPSGAGKTMVAERIGRQLGASWLQVDDLRLALQRSRVSLPTREDTAALYFFEETPEIWRQPPERLRDALIAVGAVMAPAIEVVIENHVDTAAPVVIEGDGILPALFARTAVCERMVDRRVRAVFVVEHDEEALLANMLARGRGASEQTAAQLRTEARAKRLYGEWLTAEARRYGLPVIAPRPWETLEDRLLAEAG